MTQGSTKGVPIDTDPTMALNSNQVVPSQAAVVTYVGARTTTLPVTPNNGGTGISNNVASTLTISGNFATTLTVTGATGVTLPTSGTLATTAQLPSITATQFRVLVGGAANAVSSLASSGTAGQVLQSGGAAANPAYSTATYPATAGTSGKILVSDGTNIISSIPTFPNASATSGKIIKSDGTNWLASTETYAAPSTSGNVMTSDGTNWTSAAASGAGILSVSGTLTNAQVKALHGTPVQILAAPGAGKVIQVITASFTLDYGGTNAFTAGASQTIQVYYGTLVQITIGLVNTALVSTSSRYNQSDPLLNSVQPYSSVVNTAVNLYNSVVTEITGNAANNNTVSYNIIYRTITIP